MTVVHINRGPGPVIETARISAGNRWCFGCRKRLPHDRVAHRYNVDPLDDYYGPWSSIECSRCHRDFTHFPGCDPA